jgi:hypothetical protein
MGRELEKEDSIGDDGRGRRRVRRGELALKR